MLRLRLLAKSLSFFFSTFILVLMIFNTRILSVMYFLMVLDIYPDDAIEVINLSRVHGGRQKLKI